MRYLLRHSSRHSTLCIVPQKASVVKYFFKKIFGASQFDSPRIFLFCRGITEVYLILVVCGEDGYKRLSAVDHKRLTVLTKVGDGGVGGGLFPSNRDSLATRDVEAGACSLGGYVKTAVGVAGDTCGGTEDDENVIEADLLVVVSINVSQVLFVFPLEAVVFAVLLVIIKSCLLVGGVGQIDAL